MHANKGSSNLDLSVPKWAMPKRKRRKDDGVPDSEYVPSLSDKETEFLVKKLRQQMFKERLLPPSKEITKAKLKRALPSTSNALTEALRASKQINPKNRRTLLQQIRAADSDENGGFL
jgi:ribonuclease HII